MQAANYSATVEMHFLKCCLMSAIMFEVVDLWSSLSTTSACAQFSHLSEDIKSTRQTHLKSLWFKGERLCAKYVHPTPKLIFIP